MKKHLKRDDLHRLWQSFLRHLKLMMWVTVPAVVAMVSWRHLHQLGFHFPKEDEIALTAIGAAIPAMPFGFLAVLLLGESYSRSKEFDKCLFEENKNSFLRIRDDRLPVIFHLMQMTLMTPIVVVAFGFDYASVWTGSFVVSAVVAAFSVYWVTIVVLQNPQRTPWFTERIPASWLTADVDELLPSHS